MIQRAIADPGGVPRLYSFVEPLDCGIDFINLLHLDGLHMQQAILLVLHLIQSILQVVEPALREPTH